MSSLSYAGARHSRTDSLSSSCSFITSESSQRICFWASNVSALEPEHFDSDVSVTTSPFVYSVVVTMLNNSSEVQTSEVVDSVEISFCRFNIIFIR